MNSSSSCALCFCGVAGSAKSLIHARSLIQLTNCDRTPTNGGGTPICRDVC
ncbi:hypothetical protein PF005_g30129 [Phytophthora fragariae]|uniref:Uncharacterized protein n=1 Tax=Phytophthora fragariae TaxID=53985 RepID=A0A6A3VAW9_9STRA|nr:hypothetical protein PF003_g17241 [Phytophthora fragariae]KAE8919764.1 hypothetical protein PF009_g29934 [Phytophthora fragariae]KAE8968339.1 hypothetical protein PF011_g27215 [Phytophthora fragariae]KAE9063771.1 hypothetical protein PF007_g29436 [Phytophthora fragariae]KAE9068058.1 hypothetical protein PF006_g29866 [Phytophthora fragariae]